MKYNVVVATHHKTGTVWMDGVFKAIARDMGVEYLDFSSHSGRLADALRKPFILFNHDSNFREYEEARQDAQLEYWRRISAFLGFDESEQKICGWRFWQNSLFGGLGRVGNKHVRSGEVAQWNREFTKDLGCAFLVKFPDALHSLGYEIDNSWILRLVQANSMELFAELKRLAASELEGVSLLASYSSLALNHMPYGSSSILGEVETTPIARSA